MFRWHDCLEGHILLGIVSSTIAFLCLILTTFSAPYIKGLYFLSITPPSSSTSTHFGTFGYCTSDSNCSSTSVGYSQPSSLGDGGEIWDWITKTDILYGIAAMLMFLALITLILSLLRVGKFMWNPIYFRTCALLGTLFAILAEAFNLVLWVHARQAFGWDEGYTSTYGASLWLGLVGTIFAALGAAIGGPAYQGNFMYRAHSAAAYNV